MFRIFKYLSGFNAMLWIKLSKQREIVKIVKEIANIKNKCLKRAVLWCKEVMVSAVKLIRFVVEVSGYSIHPFSITMVIVEAECRVGRIMNWVDRGVKNHIDDKIRWVFGFEGEGFLGKISANRTPVIRIIAGCIFSGEERTGCEEGWIMSQFIKLPEKILISANDSVGIERFIFAVLAEFNGNGGMGLWRITMSRRIV